MVKYLIELKDGSEIVTEDRDEALRILKERGRGMKVCGV